MTKNTLLLMTSLFLSTSLSAATWQMADSKITTDGTFGFSQSKACRTGESTPNSLQSLAVDDTFYRRLIAPDGAKMIDFPNTTVKMNSHVALSEVPLPAAIWFFTPILIGFIVLHQTLKNSPA